MPIIFQKKSGKRLVKVTPPKTVNEAIDRIVDGLEDSEKTYLTEHDSCNVHFTAGMAIRNEWGLWKESSPLKTDFINRFKLFGHADDISGIIFEGVRAKLLGQDVDKTLQDAADGYRRHWKKNCNLDPETGKSLDGREEP